MSGMRQVVVYSRKGCHLCEIVKETLNKLHRHGGFSWQEVDVDSDEALRRQFTDEVPVVFIDGRKPRLRPEDLRRIERGLKRGPQALGYETSLWTSWRVAHLIEEECGVRYHASQAWRILRQLGWSCQRPVGRALERDEEKIRLW